MTAERFKYTPAEIVLKKGEPVTLEITALDFEHGFKVPDFDLVVDLVPGKVIRVNLKPDKVGTFEFLCDNFCGSGHEDMSGQFKVVE